jgi:hypothetical protein
MLPRLKIVFQKTFLFGFLKPAAPLRSQAVAACRKGKRKKCRIFTEQGSILQIQFQTKTFRINCHPQILDQFPPQKQQI